MQITGETQMKNVAEQYSLSCVSIFIASEETFCGGLTMADYQKPTKPLSLLLKGEGKKIRLKKFVSWDKARETS